MSFLFKAVLGERVVHPSANSGGQQSDDASGERSSNPQASSRSKQDSAETAAHTDTNGVTSTSASLGDGRVIVSRDFAALTREMQQQQRYDNGPSGEPTAQGHHAKGDGGGRRAKSGSPRTDTRTLLLRVQTCPVAQDLRDALRELEESGADLPYVTGAREVIHLVELLRTHSDDGDVMSSVLRLLVSLTDAASYPQYSDGTSDGDPVEDTMRKGGRRKEGVYVVSEREKRQIRNSFLHELVPEVPLFLGVLKQTAPSRGGTPSSPSSPSPVFSALVSPFWVRFNCVRVLARLEEYKPSDVHRLLLECHGVGPIVDLLADKEKDGLLRNEALSLVSSLTATDADVQTLVAFESGFEALLSLAEEQGGVDGGMVVSECLSTTHNMLRGNAGTQKLFLQMDCAKHLCPLLEAIPRRLARSLEGKQAADRAPQQQQASSAFPAPTSMQSIIMLSTVSIIACLLREADASAEAASPSSSVRLGLVQCGVPRPLTALALCGAAVDDATRIEALRTLASLMHGCTPAVLEFLLPCPSAGGVGSSRRPSGSPSGRGGTAPTTRAPLEGKPVTTLVSAAAPQLVVAWSPLRAVLADLFASGDKTMLGACASLVSVLLKAASQSSECSAALVDEVLSGFAPVHGVSGFAAGNHTSVRASGAALALALTGPTPHASGKFYSARLFAALLSEASFAERVMQVRWVGATAERGGGSGSTTTAPHLPPSSAPVALPTVASVTLSPALPPSFLNAFVSYFIFCLNGGHNTQHMDTAAMGAYVFALVTWLDQAPPTACQQVRGEPAWFGRLLRIAADDGQVNVRFWCAALAAYLCTRAPREGVPSVPTASVSAPQGESRRAMLEMFVNQLGGAVTLDNLVFDVDASTPQWSQPLGDVFSVAAAAKPVVYDTAFVALLQRVLVEFKKICPSHASSLAGAAAAGAISPIKSPDKGHRAASPPNDRESYGGGGGGDGRMESITAQGGEAAAWQQRGATGAADSALREENEALHAKVRVQQATITSLEEEDALLREEMEQVRQELHESVLARSAATTTTTRTPAEPQETAEQRDAREANERDIRELRENVRLLEEALSSKEEEQQQLVQTLNMMELQLQQQQQHQRRGGGDLQSTLSPQAATAPAPAVSPPPPRQRHPTHHASTQTDTAEVMSAPAPPPEGQGGPDTSPPSSRKEEEEEECQQLRSQLAQVTNDRDDLLILVAELNDECVSIKGLSAMPTPAHNLPSSSPAPLPLDAQPLPQQQQQQPHHEQGQDRQLFFDWGVAAAAAAEVEDDAAAPVTTTQESGPTSHIYRQEPPAEATPLNSLQQEHQYHQYHPNQQQQQQIQQLHEPVQEAQASDQVPYTSNYDLALDSYAQDIVYPTRPDDTWLRNTTTTTISAATAAPVTPVASVNPFSAVDHTAREGTDGAPPDHHAPLHVSDALDGRPPAADADTAATTTSSSTADAVESHEAQRELAFGESVNGSHLDGGNGGEPDRLHRTDAAGHLHAVAEEQFDTATRPGIPAFAVANPFAQDWRGQHQQQPPSEDPFSSVFRPPITEEPAGNAPTTMGMFTSGDARQTAIAAHQQQQQQQQQQHYSDAGGRESYGHHKTAHANPFASGNGTADLVDRVRRVSVPGETPPPRPLNEEEAFFAYGDGGAGGAGPFATAGEEDGGFLDLR